MDDWLHAKIAPMLAGTSPPFDSDKHLFEVKWDGIRYIAFFGDEAARLQGRKLTLSSHRYPEVMEGLMKLPGNGILDGEVIVLEDGRPNFERVLAREQTASRDTALLKARRYPAIYMAFDLLYRDGKPLFDEPLSIRRELLSELLRSAPSPIVESTFITGTGIAYHRQAAERNLEGVMAKLLTSRYLPGQRTGDWLKLKVRHRVDGVLVGLVKEALTGRVKSLVLGAYDDGRLVWLGNVGSGLDARTLAQLSRELQPLAASGPPAGFQAAAPGRIEWLTPRLVVRAEYLEFTGEGRMRHPTFIGFVQKEPASCKLPAQAKRAEARE